MSYLTNNLLANHTRYFPNNQVPAHRSFYNISNSVSIVLQEQTRLSNNLTTTTTTTTIGQLYKNVLKLYFIILYLLRIRRETVLKLNLPYRKQNLEWNGDRLTTTIQFDWSKLSRVINSTLLNDWNYIHPIGSKQTNRN